MRASLRIYTFALASFTLAAPIVAQTPTGGDADLQLVVLLSRHGVRPPLDTHNEYGPYAAAPWPKWDVPAGYLTPHGFQLMKLFGAWDRAQFSGENLFAASGCTDAAHVTIMADTDERTIETGKALGEGMFPGCGIAVQHQSEGTEDPLFRPVEAGAVHPDKTVQSAAVLGRMGGDPNNIKEAYRSQLTLLDHILAGCGHTPANAARTSIFDFPDPHRLLFAASTIAENFLLEYTQGMSKADTGWGCVDGATLRTVMQVNLASWEFGTRTMAVARPQASPLIDRILKTMEQSENGNTVAGALGKPGDRLVVVVGHDTNIATVAGSLNIDWAFDGRVDDTPPGGAMLFELWRPRDGGKPFVRLEYTAQTLEQMRNTETLTPQNPPARVPVFIPACGRADYSCSWDGFAAAMRGAIDPAYVAP